MNWVDEAKAAETMRGLGQGQRAVLAVVRASWEAVNVSDIVAQTGYDRPRVLAIVASLSDRGLVERVGNIVLWRQDAFPVDKRARRLV